MSTRASRPGWARLVAGLLGTLVAVLVMASPAPAHSELDRSDPPNGGSVPVGRTTMRLWFTENVNVGASNFELRTEDGTPTSVEPAADAGSGGYVELRTEPLARAVYVLDWRILSADDGHPSHGTVLFGVGTRPLVVPSAGGSMPDASELLVRWLDLAAFLLAVGALAVSIGVLASASTPWAAAHRRARRLGAVAGVVMIASGALTPMVRTYHPGSSVGEWWAELWGTMAGTAWGRLWLAREAAVLVAAVALSVWAAHHPRRGTAVRLAVAALVATACLEARAGHASTLAGGTYLASGASAAHLLAAGVWAGGLVVLVVCVLPVMRRQPETRGATLALVARGFSPMAAIASVVLLATGLYESGRQIPDLHSLTASVYGVAISGKALLIVAALALAGANTLVVHPEPARRVSAALRLPPDWSPVPVHRFALLVAVEALVLVAAVGVAAVATTVPSSREVATADRTTAPQHATVDGLFLTVEQVPAGPAKNRVVVRARSTVLPPPAPVRGVDVQLVGPGESSTRLDLEQVEDGRFEAVTEAPAAGRWTAWVAVRRAGLPDAVAEVGWKVVADTNGRSTPFQVVMTGLAALLVAALGTASGVAARRRRLPPPVATPGRVGAGAER